MVFWLVNGLLFFFFFEFLLLDGLMWCWIDGLGVDGCGGVDGWVGDVMLRLVILVIGDLGFDGEFGFLFFCFFVVIKEWVSIWIRLL